jgi:hypothetical protein
MEELESWLPKVNKVVGLAPQLIANYWRLRGDRRNDSSTDVAALNRFEERAKMAVARKQDHLVNVRG